MIDVNDNIPAGIDISCIEGGGYAHSFHVHRAFFGFIIGRNASTLKSLQQNTKTIIAVPRTGEDGDIVINGSSRTGVLSARNRIDSIVTQSRNKLKFTHFLAIPMADKDIVENYDKFKNAVLNETGKGSEGVWEGIFQKPKKMHLTLGMLVLLDDNDVKAAVETLEECREKIIIPIIEKHGPIKIKVQGLGCFNKNPAEIRILYGSVSSDNDVLQELAEKTADCFVQKGLMRKDRDKISLHLTLMNTSFAIDKKRMDWRTKKNIDATNIMKVHQDYLFGESVMNTIQICQLGPKAEDGYYRITSKIHLADQEIR